MKATPDCTWLALLLLGLAPAASGQSYRLNDPLALGEVSGEVTHFEFSPDSTMVVYRAGFGSIQAYQAYGVPVDLGQPPTRLNEPLTPGATVSIPRVSPDGTRALFDAHLSFHTSQDRYIYSAPLDGSQGPVQLNAGLPVRSSSWRVSPDSSHVVFYSGVLYSVPLDGSLPPTPVPGANHYESKISPDSSRIVYRADQDTEDVIELYSVPLDGSAAPTKLNPTLTLGSDVDAFEISLDGSRVVYLADQDSIGVGELYSVPLNGGQQAVKLSVAPVAGGDIFLGFEICPNSSRVVYRGDQDTDQVTEIYSVPLDGSAAPTKLNPPLVLGGDVDPFSITPDGSRVVYLADQEVEFRRELYSVPTDGSAATVRLNDTPVAGGEVTLFQISADSGSVVYLADQDTDQVIELYSVPTDRSLAPVKLNEALTPGGSVETVGLRISPDSSRVIYVADQNAVNLFELFSVPLDRSQAPTRLNDPLPFRDDVSTTAFSPDGNWVVFRQGNGSVYDIFRVPPAGGVSPTRLNDRVRSPGSTYQFEFLPDGGLAYLAQQDTDDVTELYRVPLDGSAGSTKQSAPLVAGGSLQSFRLAPDGSRVAYRADQDTDEAFEFYSVALDGSQASTKLNGTLIADGDVRAGRISPDSNWFVYLADEETDEVLELYGVPLDGSSPRVKLNAPLAGSVLSFVADGFGISADSTRVVYLADQDTAGVIELYSAPLDGSAPPTRLNPDLVAGGDVLDFQLGADASRVVYRADQELDGRRDLYSVPLDGSAAPTKLNATQPGAGGLGVYLISPAGDRVIYSAAQAAAGVLELWVVPLAGGQAPIRLSGPLSPDGDVFPDFKISADGAHVAYQATRSTGGTKELFGVRTDGSSAPVLLNSPTGGGLSVRAFWVGPERVAFVYDPDTPGVFELFSVPYEGGTPTKLNEPLPQGDVVFSFDFEITPDGGRIVYRVVPDANQGVELKSVPLDGSRAPTRLNGPLVAGGAVVNFQIAPDLSRVVYHADELVNDSVELFAAHFEPQLVSLNPASGRVNAGTRVSITGTGFTPATRVMFGETPATSVTWISPTLLRVVVPNYAGALPQPLRGPAGGHLRRAQIPPLTVDVTVSEYSSASTLPAAFTYFFGP